MPEYPDSTPFPGDDSFLKHTTLSTAHLPDPISERGLIWRKHGCTRPHAGQATLVDLAAFQHGGFLLFHFQSSVDLHLREFCASIPLPASARDPLGPWSA
ncbi:hypothetical protein [Deinococcus aquaticus]|uniref:hypothetical protein n=1 Tax=Deinococcus aquaticus TaxID=328692 RepID=UPI003F447CBD